MGKGNDASDGGESCTASMTIGMFDQRGNQLKMTRG